MYKLKLFFIIFLLSLTDLHAEKVLIFTYSYNRPDFIEIHDKTFRKFLKDEYEFVVFNDASNEGMCDKINQTCEKLGIRCIRIPQGIHQLPYLERWEGEDFNHAAVRNSNVVQYSLDTLGFYHDGIVALFDSDLFLVRDFSIVDFLKGYDAGGVPQSRSKNGKDIEYMWIGLAFLNMSTIENKEVINFNCGRVEDISVDAGGHTYYFLTSNPPPKFARMNLIHLPFPSCEFCTKINNPKCTHNTKILLEMGFTEKEIKFIHAFPSNYEFLNDRIFFHYRGGSNWDGQSEDYHKKKTKILYDYINSILQD